MRPLLGSTAVFVAAVLICVQCWSHQGVEAKNRNRVQKWQQRTWKNRFGSGPRNDWKFDWPPASASSAKVPRRKNVYASVRFGGSGGPIRNELGVPNGYSNYHYRFDDNRMLEPVSVGGPRRGHRVGMKKKDSGVTLNENGVENYRMKRFAGMEEDDDDDGELVRFSNDPRRDSPFVFGSSDRDDEDDHHPERQEGLGNDLADLDFVRDDESIGFVPIQPGPNQRYVTVEEDDPFPHAAPPPPKKNSTRNKIQYTLIIHHGQPGRVSQQEDASGAPRDGMTLMLLAVALCRLLVAQVLPHFRDW